VKKLIVIEGWTKNSFVWQVNQVLADPNIEVIQTSYGNSWGIHYAYIEYEVKEMKGATSPHTEKE
jgi:hypothetical protein